MFNSQLPGHETALVHSSMVLISVIRIRDLAITVGSKAGDAMGSGNHTCNHRAGVIVPPSSVYLVCSNGPILGRFVNIQRWTPDFVDFLNFCEVKVFMFEGEETNGGDEEKKSAHVEGGGTRRWGRTRETDVMCFCR